MKIKISKLGGIYAKDNGDPEYEDEDWPEEDQDVDERLEARERAEERRRAAHD